MALAGFGLAVVNALNESSWGAFTIGMTIPIALFMGLYMYRFRKGRILEATTIGARAADSGHRRQSRRGVGDWPYLELSRDQIIVAIGAYGFIASVLPVWMLLCPATISARS